MPRGFTWCVYETDTGVLFGMLVDADSAADPIRGWLTSSIELTNPFPRGWLPRRVLGIDETGRMQDTRIGRVDAPLWTGAVTSWVVQTNGGGTLAVTRIGRQQEVLRPFPRPEAP